MHSKEVIAYDLKVIEQTEAGQRVIEYLLDYCHVFSTSMPPDCNPNMTLFNEGQRSVGNEIVSLLVNSPERFKAESLRKIANYEDE